MERRDLAWDLFTPSERSDLERGLKLYQEAKELGIRGRKSDPCHGADGVFADYYVPDPSLKYLFDHSEVVFSGTVHGKSEGFYHGSPSSLYGVQIERVWKAQESVRLGDTVFVAFSQAEIQVGDSWLCMRSWRFPDQPLPGKRILVFSARLPKSAPPIFYPMDEELFFETETSISVPDHLLEVLPSPKLTDIEDAVARLKGQR